MDHSRYVDGVPTSRRTRTYNSWASMNRRCYDISWDSYPNYGGRGVIVCDQWKDDYDQFFLDMGERPENTTLDKEQLGGIGCLIYSPDTCCWATPQEQNQNRRRWKEPVIKQINPLHHIHETKGGYNVQIKLPGISRIRKRFQSLEDAISFRDELLN